MKSYLSTILTAAAIAISLQVFSGSTLAQGRSCDRRDTRSSRTYDSRYDQRGYEQAAYGNRGYSTGYYDPYYSGNTSYNDPYYNGNGNGTSTYDRHRKAINITTGTAIGAAVGAMVGGKKGALIGAAAGAAGGAIVTAKQRPRNYSLYY